LTNTHVQVLSICKSRKLDSCDFVYITTLSNILTGSFFLSIHSIRGKNSKELFQRNVYYLQLSISIWHSCLSMGKYCKFIGHEAVIVNLKNTQ
ncbi:hypothetical protein GWI33_001284, partial [Rhynchophorus ferrugineus]